MSKTQEVEEILGNDTAKLECLSCGDKLTEAVGKVWWCDKCGYGRLDAAFDQEVYDDSYARKYESYLYSDQGKLLNTFRLQFVLTYVYPSQDSVLLDYGCASGGFVRGAVDYWSTIGYDVNPSFVQYWEKRQEISLQIWKQIDFRISPPTQTVDILTCFDSLEHVTSPGGLLVYYAPEHVFISIPLVEKKRLLTSKHYRTDEHLHYFTHKSLVGFMKQHGYRLLKRSARESELGREDVWTYAFHKKK